MQCRHKREKLNMSDLQARLREQGLKVTPQRTVLLEQLIEENDPISAEDLFKKVKGRHDSLDLVTVYRSLKKLEEVGLLARHEFGDGTNRYELTTEDGHHHHHVVCKVCGKIEALPSCDLGALVKKVQTMGYSDIGHRLEFFATCKDCQ